MVEKERGFGALFAGYEEEVEAVLMKGNQAVVLHLNRARKAVVLLEQTATINAIEYVVWNL